MPYLPVHFDPLILTGEHTPFNLMAERKEVTWQLTSIIDFGDAMIGPREYDLLGPSLFLAGGNRELILRLFRGNSYSDSDLTPELGRRLMLR